MGMEVRSVGAFRCACVMYVCVYVCVLMVALHVPAARPLASPLPPTQAMIPPAVTRCLTSERVRLIRQSDNMGSALPSLAWWSSKRETVSTWA